MSLQGRTVLVVEDDPAPWRALEDLLVRAGAIVVQTPDYRVCEILATRHPPDAVVLDVHAAAEVGVCLAAEVHLRDVPLVVVPSDVHLWLAQHRPHDPARPLGPARALLQHIEAVVR
jgi:CheY-like chemotaxis protein